MSRQEEQESAELLAKYYRYFRQQFENKKTIVPFSRSRATTFYKKHKKIFDKLFLVCRKYDIDYVKYIKFCVLIDGVTTPDGLVKIQSFVKFGNYLKKHDQYRKIYEYYVKSANNIADECIKLGYDSSRTYLRDVILSNRLGYEYITGRISKYYIASIENIKTIFSRMDLQNKTELGIIVNVSGELNQEVQEAFKMFLRKNVQPISFTDEIIKNKQENKRER